MAKGRSEFGHLLRRQRLRLGLTQEGLATRIVQLAEWDPELRELGMVSEKAISNLEAVKPDGAPHVTPRPATLMILAKALALVPGGKDYVDFFNAADRVRGAREAEAMGWPVGVDADVEVVDPEGLAPPSLVVMDGREDELHRLQSRLNHAVRSQAQIVFVAGDAGIGKSFLIREVCRLAAHADADLVVAWGESNTPHGMGDPYQPFKQILALLTGDRASTRGQQLVTPENKDRLTRIASYAAEVVVELGPDLIGPFLSGGGLVTRASTFGAKQANWLAVLQRLVENPVPHSWLTPDQLYEQLCRVLIRLAERGPLVLVLDDLHWADDGTCALLFYLARRLREVRSVPLLLIGTYRMADLVSPPDASRHPMEPVVNEVRRHWGDAVIDLTTTIGHANGRAFIDGLVDSEPNRLGEDVRAVLFERTAGLPLFAIELLHWLREQGILAKDAEGRWFTARHVTCDELPDKVNAVVAERIGRLGSDLRELLTCASVQGPVFTAEVAAHVLGIDHRELARRLDGELARRHRLVAPDGTITVGNRQRHRYRFVHALFQEYLYGSLLPLERESLHAATAIAMEHVYGTEPVEMASEVAHHFDIVGEVRKAASYYKLAADHANIILDTESAARWYSRAIELARTFDDHAVVGQCLTGVANALRLQGRVSEALGVASNARAAADRSGDTKTKADCLALLGLLHHDVGTNEASQEYFEEALSLIRILGDRSRECRVESLLSHVYYCQGDYEGAIQHARDALNTARGIGNKLEEAEGLVAVANYHVDLGSYELAIACYEDALVIHRATIDQRGEAVSLLNIGLCRAELGQYEAARSPLEQALQIGQRTRGLRTQAAARHYLGLVFEGLRQPAAAAEAYSTAIRLWRRVGRSASAVDSIAGLVRVALAEGDQPAARHGVEELMAWLTSHGTAGIEYPVRVYVTCIHALEALSDHERARLALLEAYALLMERANKIVDPELQDSFKERVPFNRELDVLWRARTVV